MISGTEPRRTDREVLYRGDVFCGVDILLLSVQMFYLGRGAGPVPSQLCFCGWCFHGQHCLREPLFNVYFSPEEVLIAAGLV